MANPISRKNVFTSPVINSRGDSPILSRSTANLPRGSSRQLPQTGPWKHDETSSPHATAAYASANNPLGVVENDVEAVLQTLIHADAQNDNILTRLGLALEHLEPACEAVLSGLDPSKKPNFELDQLLGDRTFAYGLLSLSARPGTSPSEITAELSRLGERSELRNYFQKGDKMAFEKSQLPQSEDSAEFTSFRQALSYVGHFVETELNIPLGEFFRQPEARSDFAELVGASNSTEAREQFCESAYRRLETQLKLELKGEPAAQALAKHIQSLDPTQRAAWTAAAKELTSLRPADQVDSLLLVAAKQSKSIEFIHAFSRWLRTKPELSADAISGIALKVATGQLDAEWLMSLELEHKLIEFLGVDRQTKWRFYSSFSKAQLEKPESLNRYLRGAAGEWEAFTILSSDRSLSVMSRQEQASGSIADIVVEQNGQPRGVEVKTWSPDFWKNALKAYSKYLEEDAALSTEAHALEHLFKQLHSLKKRYKRAPMVMVPEIKDQQLKQELIDAIRTHAAPGTEIRWMQSAPIDATVAKLERAFLNAERAMRERNS